jgi:hypothetical protein
MPKKTFTAEQIVAKLRTNRVVRLPDSKNGRKRNLPFWGGIEENLKRQKAYRDEHPPECEHLFFWMEDDGQLTHGGVRNAPGSPVRDFRASWDGSRQECARGE